MSKKMYDIRTSDIRKAKGIQYEDPYVFLNDVGRVLNVKEIAEDRYFIFCKNDEGKFELALKYRNSKSDKQIGVLITHTIHDNQVVPIFKDYDIKGTLLWLDKSSSLDNKDGTISIFKKTGLHLIQGSKFFAYNSSFEISVISKEDGRLIDRNNYDHIYGYGQIYK